MKRMNMAIAIVFASLFTASVANADGFLRIKCFDDNEGADVFINGKEVGTCPVDAPAPAGIVQVRARKLVDSEHERVFVKEVRVIDNVPLKMEITLSSTPQLTAEAARNREIAQANTQLRAAESGNIAAMNSIADFYAKGYGVEKSQAKAQEWRDKAAATDARNQLKEAESGNIEAMGKIAYYYTTGFGVGKNPAKAQEWRGKMEIEKTKQLEGAANAGDIDAMTQLSGRYAKGIGVKQDNAKAAEWEEKSKEAIRLKEQQEINAKQRAAAQALVYEEEQKISEIPWGFANLGFGKLIAEEKNPLAAIVCSAVGAPIATAIDVVATPFFGTTYTFRQNNLQNLKEDLERISSWGNPSSMIARSARNAAQHGENLNLLANIDN